MNEFFSPNRFYLIDALRGLAALAVVVFHYHHFYLADFTARAEIPPTAEFPWAAQMQVFYSYGFYAVELFWMISGFVFSHVYLRRSTTFWNFAVARVARLYPLHLATLVVVAVIQIISLNLAGHWQIYGNNDLRHFGLQLVFSSDWSTLSRGLSFNGPIWSVSLEMVAYALFILFLIPVRRFGIFFVIGLVASCWWLSSEVPFDMPLLRLSALKCAGYFFTGCASYLLFQRFRDQPYVLMPLALGLLVIGLSGQSENVTISALSAALILFLAIAERRLSSVGQRLNILGDISYSLYLVHVPLQMCALLAADLFMDGDRSFADSPVVLPIYLVLSIFLAYAVYHRFEKPVGKMIRKKLTSS